MSGELSSGAKDRVTNILAQAPENPTHVLLAMGWNQNQRTHESESFSMAFCASGDNPETDAIRSMVISHAGAEQMLACLQLRGTAMIEESHVDGGPEINERVKDLQAVLNEVTRFISHMLPKWSGTSRSKRQDILKDMERRTREGGPIESSVAKALYPLFSEVDGLVESAISGK